jgi:hypothetical protein
LYNKSPSEITRRTSRFLNINCLNFFSNNIIDNIHLYQISPYVLKDNDGHILENIYQGSKVYEKVDEQREIKSGKLIWEHPSEIHVKDGNLTPEFWNWNNKHAVRYPNGFYGRHICLFSLWYENGQWMKLSYIQSRKKIYCSVYCELVQQTDAYKKLKQLYNNGINLQICEIDVRPCLLSREVLEREINNTKEPFGHGYVLATCLMECTDIFQI